MKRIATVFVMFFFIFGCKSDKGIVDNTSLSDNQVSTVRFYFPKPAELDSIVIMAKALVSAPDMDSIFAELVVTATQVEGVIENIPAGLHRKFEIFTYDADTNLTYYGHSFSDVIAGQTITVQITLYPVNTTGTVIIVGTFSNFPPQAGKIVFEANFDGSIDLYRINPDGTNIINLTNMSETDEVRPCISPDGQKVLFSKRYPSDIFRPFIMNMDGSNPIELNIQPTANVVTCDWSPDMQKIAFHSDADGDREIYIYDLGTNQIVQVTKNSSRDWCPKWSPDGQWIMYFSDESGIFLIYLIHPDGTNKHLLLPQTTSIEQKYGQFSPDGSKILFYGRDSYSAWDMFIINSDGTNLIRLNPSPNINDYHGCWSPDGQKILFIKYDSMHNGMYTMNLDGTEVQVLLDTPFLEDYPDWK